MDIDLDAGSALPLVITVPVTAMSEAEFRPGDPGPVAADAGSARYAAKTSDDPRAAKDIIR